MTAVIDQEPAGNNASSAAPDQQQIGFIDSLSTFDLQQLVADESTFHDQSQNGPVDSASVYPPAADG